MPAESVSRRLFFPIAQTRITASTGVYEIVPGFIVSFLAAYLVARFTEAPNAEAVAIFEEATKPDAD